MTTNTYETWLNALVLRINGLAKAAQYGNALVAGEKLEESKVHRFRVKLDSAGCIVGPSDATVVGMEGVHFDNRAPVSPANRDHSVNTIQEMLADPSGSNAAQLQARLDQVEAWKKNPYEALDLPAFEPAEAEAYHDLLFATKGKRPADIVNIINRRSIDLDMYFAWHSRDDKQVNTTTVEDDV